jgi:transposase
MSDNSDLATAKAIGGLEAQMKTLTARFRDHIKEERDDRRTLYLKLDELGKTAIASTAGQE